MPVSIANQIGDSFTRHTIDLLRLSASERKKVLTMLNGIQQDLLTRLIETEGVNTSQTRRLEALFVAAEGIIQQGFKAIAKQQRASLIDVGEYASDQTKEIVNRTVGVSFMTVGVSQETLKALVDDDTVMGVPAQDWWAQQAKSLKASFQQTIRQGVFASESLSELTRRVRGTRESGFTDGLMQTTTRNAESLIRTSVLSIANAARYETYQANDDVIGGQQWLSTLDPRTCPICMALSGQAWDLDGNPLEGTTQKFPSPPPAHWACRCTLTPVLKSWEQLAEDAKGDEKLGRKLDRVEKKIAPSTQASLDGQVADDIDYDTWLQGRSVDEQQAILGPGKYALWKKGKIGLTDLVDMRGQPRTLEQLKQAS